MILIGERGIVLSSKENLGMCGGHFYKEKGKERKGEALLTGSGQKP